MHASREREREREREFGASDAFDEAWNARDIKAIITFPTRRRTNKHKRLERSDPVRFQACARERASPSFIVRVCTSL